MQDPDNQELKRNLSLIEYLKLLNVTSGFDNLGIDASVDISTVSLEEYKNIISDKQQFYVETYSRAEIDALFLTHQKAEKLSVYPNPFDEFIYISLDDFAEIDNFEIKIIDLYGRVIYAEHLPDLLLGNNFKIETSNLPSGLYSIVMTSKTFYKSLNLVKISKN